MSALVYPASLPCPTSAPFAPTERRGLSSLPGPRRSRTLWRDRHGSEPVQFTLTFEEAATWIAWIENEQLSGGAWFAATWRLPHGGSGVYRFTEAPSYPAFIPAVGWRVQANVEVRGRSLPPQARRIEEPWTDRALPFAAAWQYTAWSEELHLFVSVAVGSQCATSPDGETWTARNMPSSASWSRLVWAPELGLFVAVAYDTNKAATSPDGETWTARTLPTVSLWAGLAWNGSTLCLIDNNFNRLTVTSPDGIDWTAHAAALPSSASWDGVVWAPELGLFVTIASFSTKAATSPDGETWTARTLPANRYWREIAWSGETLVVTDYNPGASTCLLSPDGIDWTETPLPVATKWGSVCWNDSRKLFCMVGNGDQSLFSNDGVDWLIRPMGSSRAWYTVVWGHGAGVFVALADVSTNVANSKRYT